MRQTALARLKTQLGPTWRRAKAFGFWASGELPKSPALQLYGKLIDRDNIELTVRLRQGKAQAFADYAAPYRGMDIPKIVWIFWAQGEHEAPSLVKRCIASWREKNPDWDIRVLTRETVGTYVDLSVVSDALPFRFHADYLRLKLLAQWGGVWADATTLCHRPLSDWMPLLGGRSGFFVFRGPHHDRWIDNWFIAAHPGNALIGPWAEDYTRYVMRLTTPPSIYFMMIYVLQHLVRKRKDLRLAFRASGGLPAVPAFMLQAYLEGNSDAEPFIAARNAGFPVSKLNWRLDMSDADLSARLDALGV